MNSFEGFVAYVKGNTDISEANKTQKEILRNFSGQIIGYIEISPNGDQELKNYSGKILGRYVSNRNITQNWSGTILSYGNTLSMLLK